MVVVIIAVEQNVNFEFQGRERALRLAQTGVCRMIDRSPCEPGDAMRARLCALGVIRCTVRRNTDREENLQERSESGAVLPMHAYVRASVLSRGGERFTQERNRKKEFDLA